MRSVSHGRLVCSAVVLCSLVAAPSRGVDDALAARGEVPAEGMETAKALSVSEPGSSEGDFLTAVQSARHAPRLRSFDAAAHDRAKRIAPHSPSAAAGRLAPDPDAPRPGSPSAAVTSNFAGLNRSTAVNNGFVSFPPDTHLAKSPNRAIEAVNSALRLFNNAGGTIGTANLNTFFGASISNGLVFDPKVIYDRNAVNKRFYVVALQKNSATKVSRIWVAVSRSQDPPSLAAANWCRYNLDGRRNAGTANASWADYPGIGNGFDSLILSFNQFRFSNDSFTYVQVKAARKIPLANNAGGCPAMTYFTFQPSATISNVDAFTLQPVQANTTPSSFAGTSNPAYLVSNRATTPTSSSRLWRIRNVAGAPTIQFTALPLASTTVPPDAPQPGGVTLIDTGDVRVLAAASVGNVVSAVHTTGCQFGAGAAEACTSFRRFSVGQNGAGAPTVATQQTLHGYGYGENSYSFWPSVAVLGNHSAMMTFQVIDFSPVVRLSTYINLKTSATAWTTGFNVATGGCAQSMSNRSGDYTGAASDPALNAFWFAGERTLSIGGACVWDTRWGRAIP